MSDWGENATNPQNREGKKIASCGRKDFSKISDIKKDTYICTLHLEGQGPTKDYAYPVLATLTEKEHNQQTTQAKTRARPKKRRENPIEEAAASKKYQRQS